MSLSHLHDAEKSYVIEGFEENVRADGRKCDDYRPVELETNLVAHAYGSSRIRLSNTDVLTAVKLEIDSPLTDKPDEGKLEFYVDFSANASPLFEGRGGEELSTKLAGALGSAYQSSTAFNLKQLCILKGRKCWKMYVDILVLECGGNLFDAVSMGVKCALATTRIPRVTDVDIDGDNVDISVSEDVADCVKLNLKNAPLMVTVGYIADRCVLDLTYVEEQCCKSALVCAISNLKLKSVIQIGCGSLHRETLLECVKFAQDIYGRLNDELMKAVAEDDERNGDVIGFL